MFKERQGALVKPLKNRNEGSKPEPLTNINICYLLLLLMCFFFERRKDSQTLQELLKIFRRIITKKWCQNKEGLNEDKRLHKPLVFKSKPSIHALIHWFIMSLSDTSEVLNFKSAAYDHFDVNFLKCISLTCLNVKIIHNSFNNIIEPFIRLMHFKNKYVDNSYLLLTAQVM